MGKRKCWSKEETEYLEEKWGVNSISNICSKLGRTETAIRIKAYKLGLGRFTDNGEYITFNQLINCFESDKTHTYKRISWIEKRGLPVKNKLINQRRVKIIYIDDFWKWAQQNKNHVDFSSLTRYSLGKEPSWVEKQRQYDIQTRSKYKRTPWTMKEDEYLVFLLKEFKYTYKEISEKLCRTVGAVDRRIHDLKIKERPLREDSQIKWTDEEINLLNMYIKDGMGYELMSDKIGKSTKSIRGKVYRLYGSEVLDKVMLKI